jgi:uncharacterized protein (TIGR00255 family)
MPRSMTGFGQASRTIGGLLYTVEVRSVNNRYFKANVRLPDAWLALETRIDQLLRRRLNRGSAYLALRVKAEGAEAAARINSEVLERYMEQLEIIRPDQVDVDMSADLASLLQLPGVLIQPTAEPDSQQQPEVLELVGEAIEGLLDMRAEEGKTIERDLLECCEVIARRLSEIADQAPRIISDYYERLKRRVDEMLAKSDVELDADTVAREVALFAERCDVAEEISRLASHLTQFRKVLAQDQPGRKLDFIAQEMLREANTIASKGNSAEIGQAVVDIKTSIDRIKEQVQNIE